MNTGPRIQSILIAALLTVAAQAADFDTHILTKDSGVFDGPNSLDTADVDGDGDIDILIASAHSGQYTVHTVAYLENDGCQPPTFTKRVVVEGVAAPLSVTAGDLDRDGHEDVVTVYYTSNTVVWHKNDGRRPATFVEHVIPTAKVGPRDVAVSDIDDDGDLDVIVAWGADSNPFVLPPPKITWHDSNGGNPPVFTNRRVDSSSSLPDAWSVYVADMDNDNHQDILTVGLNGPTVWYKNDGSSPPSWTENTITTEGAWEVFAKDVNGDGCTDALVARGSDGAVLYQSDCNRAPAFSSTIIGGSGTSVVAQDIDDDGDIDVLLADSFDDTITLFESDGASTPAFTSRDIYAAEDGLTAIAVADLDADDDIDILSVSLDGDEIAWFESDVISPTASCPSTLALAFSVDIGSDAELSDPNADGDEGFDSGDVYRSDGDAVDVSIGGRDGSHLDDADIFSGDDPDPDAPDSTVPPTTAVPVGVTTACPTTGRPTCYENYFDIDGVDTINVSLGRAGLGIRPYWPLKTPIRKNDVTSLSDQNCIYTTEYLALSFDDDDSSSWVTAEDNAPVNTTSAEAITYGTSDRRDEVVGITLDIGGSTYPLSSLDNYAVADEVTVHSSLGPNPDSTESDDDDVDALDVLHYDTECSVRLFSVDNEANGGLAPGAIYEVSSGTGPSKVLRPHRHLGLARTTDIDAFEMAWLRDPNPDPDTGQAGLLSLAILFSVDNDDTRTRGDESGGLEPGTIYGSFMDGVSFEVVQPGARLYGIDVTGNVTQMSRGSGAATLLGRIPYNVNSMAANSAGRIFTVHGTSELIEIEIDWFGTVSSSVYWTLTERQWGSIRGLAFSPNNLLYAVQQKTLSYLIYIVEVDGGGGNLVGVKADGRLGHYGFEGLAVDAAGVLYLVHPGDGLFTLPDLSQTYNLTHIGSCGLGLAQALEFDIDGSTLLSASSDLEVVDVTCAAAAATVGALKYDIRGLAAVRLPEDDIDAIAVGLSRVKLD